MEAPGRRAVSPAKAQAEAVLGPFTAHITLDQSYRGDADNAIKLLLDTAKGYGLIQDDGPKYMRRLLV
jgi:hypothetical protein